MAADPTAEFFAQLSGRRHEPLLANTTGVVRFDLLDNGHSERWIVAIDSGEIDVSRRNVSGDCRFRMSRSFFERVVRGDANAAAAVFRGEIQVEGEWRLLVLAQRLFALQKDSTE